MERYKKTLLTRIYAMTFFGFAILVGYILKMSELSGIQSMGAFSEFYQGFQLGIIIFVEVIFAYLITRYIITLQKPEELKKLYYRENDERIRTIREKSGGHIIFVCAITILITAIIAGYFNEIIFWTLVACSLFLFITRKVLIIYYSQRL